MQNTNELETDIKSSTEITNSIKLMSVSELMGKHFYVPSYQRGYRWTRQQVEDLLDDIYSFAIKKDKLEKEFYCLQPVIVKYDAEQNHYELIDGQQRLTTLFIILNYIINQDYNGKSFSEEFCFEMYDLEYQTRPRTKVFLSSIVEGNDDNIDFMHIANAFTAARGWFEKQGKRSHVRRVILNTLTLGSEDAGSNGLVRVIWYEIRDPQINPIDMFIRINLGKIPLTNSELIRALFLQERILGHGNHAKLRQLQIAQEWDEIENKLQNEQFWWFLNRSENTAASHIEFIFDMMKDVALKNNEDLIQTIGEDGFVTFRYFNDLFSKTDIFDVTNETWSDVKRYFEFFVECFENPVWYHYIGFLIYCGTSVQDIYSIMNDSRNATKDDATERLKDCIRSGALNGLKWKNISPANEPVNYVLDVTYGTNDQMLRKVLLLFNLEFIVKQTQKEHFIYKFPFKSFKIAKAGKNEASWDIEHIDSATENKLDKEADQRIWLEYALEDVPALNNDLELKLEIVDFIADPEGKSFIRLYEKVRILSGEDAIPEEVKNSLGNLTLLDAGTNRGYGNALFITKRRKIVEKDQSGTFIPICTKYVFFKYFGANPKSSWNIADVEAYRRDIEETLEDLLPRKNAKNGYV